MRKSAKRQGLGSLLAVLLALPGLAVATDAPAAGDPIVAARHFTLNEQMITDLQTPPDAKACAPQAVLTDLLRQIGPTAKVFPTENYYYFQFYRGGMSYSGSLRFTLGKRDEGIVDYACYPTYVSWLETDHTTDFYAELSAKSGFQLTHLGGLDYELSVGGLATRFSLNNLDQTANPAVLAPGERFLGRGFDDAGLAFDVVYDPKRKIFFFVLDTRGPVAETFVQVSPKVSLGRRTGFVFYQEDTPKRMVMVAANADEIYDNTWYDGPFDHLPENFYGLNGFWQAVYEAFPQLKGKLTPSGMFIGEDTIFAMMPYRGYQTEAGLAFIKTCAQQTRSRGDLIACMTSNPDE